ncbi:MAG: hypothetical protein HC906_07070 [Bacteroidales bacterium]|nr:hypothetical protein [Bacteroidales bacterium]
MAVTTIMNISCDDDDNGDDNGGDNDTTAIMLNTIADGFVAPVALVEAPDNSNRLFVVDQVGVIHIIESDTIFGQYAFS